jgi:hypothetical protein
VSTVAIVGVSCKNTNKPRQLGLRMPARTTGATRVVPQPSRRDNARPNNDEPGARRELNDEADIKNLIAPTNAELSLIGLINEPVRAAPSVS